MFSRQMFFIFTNCNVSCLDNILFRQNLFLCQFCTWQRYVLVHVLKQFMSKGSMIMVKIRDYRRNMSFFIKTWIWKKIAWQMFVQCTIKILYVLQIVHGLFLFTLNIYIVKWKCYKVLYKFIIKSKDIILKVVQKWNIKLLLHLDISISVKGFFFKFYV